MKINPEQLGRLVEILRTVPLKESLPPSDWAGRYKAMALSETRFLFDWLWGAGDDIRSPWFDQVYASGCNDDHVLTALRAAAKELGVDWSSVEPAKDYQGPAETKGFSILADVPPRTVVSNLDSARVHQQDLEP